MRAAGEKPGPVEPATVMAGDRSDEQYSEGRVGQQGPVDKVGYESAASAIAVPASGSTADSSRAAESPIARSAAEMHALAESWVRTAKSAADGSGAMAAIVHNAIEIGPVAVGFLIDAACEEARAEEREACAKECELHARRCGYPETLSMYGSAHVDMARRLREDGKVMANPLPKEK